MLDGPESLDLASFCGAFAKVDEALFDLMCSPWKGQNEAGWRKLVLLKKLTDMIRPVVLASIPDEHWRLPCRRSK